MTLQVVPNGAIFFFFFSRREEVPLADTWLKCRIATIFSPLSSQLSSSSSQFSRLASGLHAHALTLIPYVCGFSFLFFFANVTCSHHLSTHSQVEEVEPEPPPPERRTESSRPFWGMNSWALACIAINKTWGVWRLCVRPVTFIYGALLPHCTAKDVISSAVKARGSMSALLSDHWKGEGGNVPN